jgi:hypothetical protein
MMAMNSLTIRTGSPAERAGKGRLKAAWTLVLLAPLCAEATFTGISLPTIWLAFPLLIPMYGGGVLLLRELVVRAGAGWLGLLVLGFAYELAEDGLGLQALTSPHLYNAAHWGRVFGLNVTYWESQLGYHLVFTVLIPVALTTMIFRRQAARPYLGPFGLAGTAVAFVIGIALTRAAISGTEDRGYTEPWPVAAVLLAGMVVLGVLALVVVPRLRLRGPAPVARLPRPIMMGTVAMLAPIVFLVLLFPLKWGSDQPAIGRGGWVAIPMVLALVLAIAIGWLVARWVVTDTFTDRHRIWLIGGALVGHSVFAMISGFVGGGFLSPLVLGVVVIGATVLLLVGLDRRLRRAD